MKQIFKKLLVAPLLLVSSIAFADIFNFNQVTANNVENLGSQLSVNVTDNGAGSVYFTFNNNVGIASSVAEIYFDNKLTNFFSGFSIISQIGTSMADGSTNPADPPGIASFVADYSVDVNPGPPANGLNNAADFITIAGLLSGADFSDVITAINGGAFDVAMHVRSIGQAVGSDSYNIVGTPNAVPLPAAAWLFMSGLGLFGIGKKRSKL